MIKQLVVVGEGVATRISPAVIRVPGCAIFARRSGIVMPMRSLCIFRAVGSSPEACAPSPLMPQVGPRSDASSRLCTSPILGERPPADRHAVASLYESFRVFVAVHTEARSRPKGLE